MYCRHFDPKFSLNSSSTSSLQPSLVFRHSHLSRVFRPLNSCSASWLQRCTLTEGDSVCLQGSVFYANPEFPNSKKGHTGRPVVPAPGASPGVGERRGEGGRGRGEGMEESFRWEDQLSELQHLKVQCFMCQTTERIAG